MQRRAIDARYRKNLAGIAGIACLPACEEQMTNHAYFPILVRSEYGVRRDELYQVLRDHDIFARRYFYPLISDFPMYRGMPSAAPANLPQARQAADQVICLPIYPGLSDEQIDTISAVIAHTATN